MVFFMEKALIMIVVMYATSFSLFGAQYVIGDVFGITLTNFQGQPLKTSLFSTVNNFTNNVNTRELNVTNIQGGPATVNSLQTAANAGWQLFQLLTGTYILNLLYFFGVPFIFVSGFTALYLLFAIRAIIGMIKEFI